MFLQFLPLILAARLLVEPSPELLEGDMLTLTCDVMGIAPEDSTFSWYKNSKRLQGSDGGALAFQRVTSSDAGSYHCKAHPSDEMGTSVSPVVSITVFCEWRFFPSVMLSVWH